MDRRTFLAGAMTTIAGTAALGALAGCSPQTGSNASAKDDEQLAQTGEAVEFDEELDTEIVILGGGMSGMAAAIRAAELGARVTLVEARESLGGNGSGTEGVFAVGSKYQKQLGINVTLSQIVSGEQDFFKSKIDNLLWKDLVSNSADTLEWLESQGVEFSGVVDECAHRGKVEVFHWYKENATESHIKPMSAKVAERGVDIKYNTRAFKIIVEDGKAVGAYARTDDDRVLKINAGAVIVATGGYVDNPDMIRQAGLDPDLYFAGGFGDHVGEGIQMALEVGARNDIHRSCFIREATVEYMPGSCAYPICALFFTTPSMVWVNEDGERYADENCLSITTGCMSNAAQNQRNPYAIFTEDMLKNCPIMIDGVEETAYEEAQEMLERNDGNMLRGETVEELAEQMGVPVENLAATLERYNGFCEAGVDEDYAKDPSALTKLEGPLYAGKLRHFIMTTLGGIATNRKAEVIDESGEAIPGLYAVGVDGCELYYGTYTISVPASCNGNNAYSGKNAAQNAVEYLA